MMRYMRTAFAAVGMVMLSGCAAVPTERSLRQDPSLAGLAFLEGSWTTEVENPVEGQTGGGEWVEEHWTDRLGGTMLGMSRTVSFPPGGAARTVGFEYLRIERRADGDVYYMASPQGKSPATPFKLVKSEASAAVFENTDNDFPSRIIYRLEEDGSLVARIEGTRNGHADAMAWRYVRMDK